jgi:non-specific serine/threonine protein kinase
MQAMTRTDGNLPADVTSFVGRRREVAALRDQLGASRLVTLTGVGGVGKTRMALRVAAESQKAFPDGAFFVELAALEDATLLADTVASALGVENHTTRTPLSQLSHQLADKQMLIVLDNCEHISEACAELVHELLRGAPRIRFLVTSRHSLGVLGEQIFTVPPLSTPRVGACFRASSLQEFDSVALLRARAANSVSDFDITDDNSALVARLCERLDGIPLAIELAAARLRTLPVGEVLDRLDRRFQLLSAGNSSGLPRHQTLAALIDWSYALCSVKEQTLWARLSVFAGSFALPAAEAICAGDGISPDEILDLVDALVRKSILIVERSGEHLRYRLLETLREYGRDRLAETAASAHVQLEHLKYFQRLAELSFEEWCGPRQAAWLARLRAEHANLRSAFDRCIELGHADQACTFAAALQWFWIAGGNLGEGRVWLGQALVASAGREPSHARAKAMWVDSYLALLRGELVTAGTLLDEVQGFAATADAPALRGYVAQLRGMAALFAGELDDARVQYEHALASHQERDDTAGALAMMFQLAVVCLFTGEHARATSLCEQSLQLSAGLGERWATSYASWALGVNKWSHGDLTGATEVARQGLAATLEFGDQLGIVHMVELMSWIYASDGRYADGARLLGAARTIWNSLGTSIHAFGAYLYDCEAATEARLRDALGAATAQALIAEGGSLSIEQAAAAVMGSAEESTPTAPTSESNLSAREMEVAQLVAQGLTNREIAAELVLSSRTIDSHVQHILTKLDFNTRSQIAGWVVGRQPQ